MIYRRFGRTDLQVPAFSCGGMRYQQSWTRDAPVRPASQENLQATIDRALDLGINHVETARGYGTSEQQLGPALARHPRDRFILQTKGSPTDDPRVFEANLEDSFRRLQVGHLDLFGFHGLNTQAAVDATLRPGGCLEVAEKFRRQGRIRHIGFSTHATTPIILQTVASGRFNYLNLHYYFVFQDNLAVLQAAREQDMGVFIISPTDKGGRLQKPSQKMRDLCAPLSPMVFNDLWCLAHDQIHTLSLGAARPSDFDEHLSALPLLARAAEILPPIVARLESAYRAAVGEDFSQRWQQGLRNWEDLPGQINVRRILWLRGLVLAYDMLPFAQERYAAMSPDDHWVPGARAGDVNDSQMVAALPDSPYRQQIPALLRQTHQMLEHPGVKPQP